jgi:hypothetical protein
MSYTVLAAASFINEAFPFSGSSLTIIYAPCRFLRLALSAFLRHSDDFSLGLISQKSTQIVSRGMDVYTVLEAPHLKRRIPLPDCLLTRVYNAVPLLAFSFPAFFRKLLAISSAGILRKKSGK